jgi:hypothetical protein
MSSAYRSGNTWLTICGVQEEQLAAALSERVASWRESGLLSDEERRSIEQLSYSLTGDGFATSPERMELLRQLCQVFSRDVRPQAPTSHRKVIGPLIVLAKRILYPLVNAVLGPTFQQQREFNALSLTLLTDLANEAGGSQKVRRG